MQTLSLSRTLLSAAVASAFALAAVNASADLSSRYVDSDGDMIADVPSDESQWVDRIPWCLPIPRLKIPRFTRMSGLTFWIT